MNNPHNSIPVSGSRPVKRTAVVRKTTDKDGRQRRVVVESQTFALSPDGSVDHVTVTADRFYHCGHSEDFQPLGGQCGEPGCNRRSCVQCFTHCQKCGKPLCMEHVRKMTTDNEQVMNVCVNCHDIVKRRRVWSAIGRLVLKPFVNFNPSKGA